MPPNVSESEATPLQTETQNNASYGKVNQQYVTVDEFNAFKAEIEEKLRQSNNELKTVHKELDHESHDRDHSQLYKVRFTPK
ncbi:hypothetical protein DIURU_001747 [Diutina rugosa]|uniref:Uncharacterized protein n=1 Tax=Diutina rugosa TaxID=5481 RepID=A0A642UXR6_DIURU|nr:uncharacterized protein DIURU_001747 [Diutina rugosa]KAA8904911.1 hypothetical protein DIURU_001747 [Diutina rugosa]